MNTMAYYYQFRLHKAMVRLLVAGLVVAGAAVDGQMHPGMMPGMGMGMMGGMGMGMMGGMGMNPMMGGMGRELSCESTDKAC